MPIWKHALPALAVLWPLCAWAAAPPYLHPDEYGGIMPPPFVLEEPFKGAVVGGRMLAHQREEYRVSVQAIPLGGPPRLRRYFVPVPPYPGPQEDEDAVRRRRAGLTITAHVYEFPIRWHLTKDAYYVAE